MEFEHETESELVLGAATPEPPRGREDAPIVPVRFEYRRLGKRETLLQLAGLFSAGRAPVGPQLLVRNQELVTLCTPRRTHSAPASSGLIWAAGFVVALDVATVLEASFELFSPLS